MTDETQVSTKLPNINEEEREWLSLMLIGLKPRDVYEPFLCKFPRLAEYAEEHGISDKEVKQQLIHRFYDMNHRRKQNVAEVMDIMEKRQFTAFTNMGILLNMMMIEEVLKMQIEVSDALANKNTSEEALNLLDKRQRTLDKHLKRVGYLNKLETNAIKFDMLTLKTLLKEDTDPAQPKPTQSPGDFDWNDESWLEGGEDE